MLWNKCSYFLIDHAKEPALVLITKDKWLDPSKMWLGDMVIKAYDIHKHIGLYITPIISPLIDENLQPGIMPLHEMLGLDKSNDKFPRLFVIHGKEGTIVEYPKSLDDPMEISGELIALWARRTIIYQEIKLVKAAIQALNESLEENSMDDALDYAQLHRQLKEELAVVKQKHDETIKMLQEAKLEALK